jgi:hypothetical protein
MTPGETPIQPTEPPAPSILAGVLSYLVPGLGHIAQGRTGKGVMFMGILLGMFFLGQAMGNWQNVYMPEVDQRDKNNAVLRPLSSIYNRWHFAGQFWIGVAAWPAIWQFYKMPMPEAETSEFWHRFQREPDENVLNPFLTDSDKSPDLGWVYTVVAGMLNILVIYDAVMGPAFAATPRRAGDAADDAAGTPQPVGAEGTAS